MLWYILAVSWAILSPEAVKVADGPDSEVMAKDTDIVLVLCGEDSRRDRSCKSWSIVG